MSVGSGGSQSVCVLYGLEFSHPVNALNFCLLFSCINTDCPRELQSICVSPYVQWPESTHWSKTVKDSESFKNTCAHNIS